VAAQGRDGCAAHLQVFTRRTVAQDVAHGLVAHRLLGGALASDRRLARYFRASCCLYRFAAALLGLAASFGYPLTSGRRAATSVCSLVSISLS
jgi:hypothetical protein